MLTSETGVMIPVLESTPPVFGVEAFPVVPEGFMCLGTAEIYTFFKEVKIDGEFLPVEGILMSYGAFGGTIYMANPDGVSIVKRIVNKPWHHRGEDFLLFSERQPSTPCRLV